MTDRLIAPADWRAEPWKNGRGITHVIARWPDHDDYVVRISVAVVSEPGPFSTFPGYRRWSVRLGDAPIGLAAGADVRWLPQHEIVELAGEREWTAVLPEGATRLLNIVGTDRVEVGIGAAEAIQFAFALDDTGIARWHARWFADRGRVEGNVVWARLR